MVELGLKIASSDKLGPDEGGDLQKSGISRAADFTFVLTNPLPYLCFLANSAMSFDLSTTSIFIGITEKYNRFVLCENPQKNTS